MADKNPTILHAIDTTGPGGAETVFLDLAEKLIVPGFENYAVIKGPGWVEDQLRRRGIRYYIVKPHGFLSIPYYYALFRLVRANNTALIQAHLLGSALTYSILSFFLRTPLIATLHGRVDVNPNERFVIIKQMIMRSAIKRLITVSQDLASYIAERRLFNRNAINVIYNGIDEKRYGKAPEQILRKQLGIPHDALLVASLGNIRPAKSYETLIKTAAIIKAQSDQNVHFIIAGHKKPELMAALEKLMIETDVADRMHFIGFHDNTAAFLGQADYFILSSSSEGFSISTIEAMASGLPVVATRCGGPEEILEDQKTGLLVPINSPSALVSALNSLINNPEMAMQIATAGKIHAVNIFSLTRMLDAYREEYLRYLPVANT